MKIRLFVSGRAYHTAAELPRELALSDGASVDEALVAVAGLLSGEAELSSSSLIAVSGAHLGTLASHTPRVLREGDELAIITPVAGG